MIVDDYKNIRRRMLGELKPEAAPPPEPECKLCQFCSGTGWLNDPFGAAVLCPVCKNPKGLPCP